MDKKNVQLEARINYFKRFQNVKSWNDISFEEVQREGLRNNLEQFIISAENFYKGINVANKFLFLKLGINIFNKKNRIKLAGIQLAAAEVYIENAKSKEYVNSPEFEDLINRYNSLFKKLK